MGIGDNTAGTVVVDVEGDFSKLRGQFQSQGKVAAGLLGGAVLGGAAGLAKIGGEFDDAFDTIRVGTGATGDALAGLQDDFRAVGASVPGSFSDAGTAVADLNTRLGLTGQPLQNISTQMLELSRITKTDLGGNIESATRFLGDAGIAAEDMSGALDSLFRASQATGPSVQRLADLSVQYGAPLRQFGFSFEESAALLGKFEKEGVNTELVMGSLRIALGKFSKAGEDPVEALEANVDAIKNAGSTAEANALAFEIFGARAGADMAGAIREGRFELGDLFDTVANGEETILGVADVTKDWREGLQELRNKAFLKLEPAATKLFESIGRAVESASPFLIALAEILGVVAEAFAVLPGPVQAVIVGVAAFAVGAAVLGGPVMRAVTAIKGLSTAFTALAANPWTLAIIAAVAAVYIIVKYWDEIKAALVIAWNWVAEQAAMIWGGIQATFSAITSAIGGFFDDYIIRPVEWIIDLFAGLPDKATTAWNGVKSAIATVAEWIKTKLDEIGAAADRALGPIDEIIGAGAKLGGGIISGAGSLLGFDDGGVVPGPRGAPRLVLAHAGETILPTHKDPGVGVGGMVVQGPLIGSATIGSNMDLETVARELDRRIDRLQRAKGRRA